MAASLRNQIRRRAGDRCEYCRLPQVCSILPHEVDHIRSRNLHGPTTLDNTAWSCAQCNGAKGPHASAYDPLTNKLVRLFNPRADRWDDHFAWDGPMLVGKTPIGRATIDLLRINRPDRVEHRRLLIAAGQLVLERG
jgi:hypothetical protein